MTSPRWVITCVALALCGGATLAAGRAQGQGFGGQVSYTGGLGPIGEQRPLCVCIFTDPQLLSGIGCLIFHQNPVHYSINSLAQVDYYLVAFVDVHLNEQLDADEPFQIYRGRDAPPADAVSSASGATDIDFTFGDENLPGAFTPTPSATPSPSPTLSPSPSSTPTAVAGDCDGNGSVTIDELVRGVDIALGALTVDACVAADINRDGTVTIAELVLAVNAALGR